MSQFIEHLVRDALASEPIVDMHTHLYPPTFGTPTPGASGQPADPNGLMLWGVDEILTYHYLIAEVFRVVPARVLPYETFWKMPKREQADHIFKQLFVERAPISEACRGVLTTLQKLGLDPSDKTPDRWRAWCASMHPSDFIDRVMQAANVRSITMTNNVFDDNERERWLADPKTLRSDPRFKPVLRIDPLINNWPGACKSLASWGYKVEESLSPQTVGEVKRFLSDWLDRTQGIYIAMSLPPSFRYPSNDAAQKVFDEALLPVCAERNLPLALMIGATRGANPALKDAGDRGGPSDVTAVVNLCRSFPNNRFFVTMLSRENQHDLAVAARKFGNLMIFGCWWFLNIPSQIEEITAMRTELLGTSFIPQHSDARVIDQLLYKWEHSRGIIAKVLTAKFKDLSATGREVTADMVRSTVKRFVSQNFEEFVAGR